MTATNQFIQEDLDFIAGLNDPGKGTPISETLKADWLRNLDRPALQQFENITRRVFEPNFVLCFSCSNEIMAMVRRVMGKYESEQEQQGDPMPQMTAIELPADGTEGTVEGDLAKEPEAEPEMEQEPESQEGKTGGRRNKKA